PFQPKWPIEDNGTLTPEAKAANIFINTAYIPVITPTFEGNFILTNPGNNTLPNAIAIPIKRVPKNKAPVPNKERRIIPTASNTNDKNRVYSILIRLAILGANGDKTAKASNGNVVIVPANAWLISKSVRINGINDPIEVKGALKFAAINMTPITKSHVLKELFSVCSIVVFRCKTSPPV